MFTFPVQPEWSLTLRNIISFCLLPFADMRPDHNVLLGMLRNEMTSLEQGGIGDSMKQTNGRGDEYKIETDSQSQTFVAVRLSDLYYEDLTRLKRNV